MQLAAAYHALIERLIVATAMPDKLLHVHAGLAIYVLAQIALRDRRGSWQALAVVAGAEAGNEIMDRLFSGGWNLPDTVPDVAATLFWPTVLVLVGRYRRERRDRRQAALRVLGAPLPGRGVGVPA